MLCSDFLFLSGAAACSRSSLRTCWFDISIRDGLAVVLHKDLLLGQGRAHIANKTGLFRVKQGRIESWPAGEQRRACFLQRSALCLPSPPPTPQECTLEADPSRTTLSAQQYNPVGCRGLLCQEGSVLLAARGLPHQCLPSWVIPREADPCN